MKRSKVTEEQIAFALRQAENGIRVEEWRMDYNEHRPHIPSGMGKTILTAILLILIIVGCSDDGDENPVDSSAQRAAISTALVIQTSLSMGFGDPKPITLVEDASRTFVRLMDGVQDESTLAWFNTLVSIRHIMTTDTTALLNIIDNGFPTSGGAAIWNGLYGGMMELGSNGIHPRKAVILFTDGKYNASKITAAECVEKAHSDGIRVFIFSFGDEFDATVLREVARQAGGEYIHNPTAFQIKQIFEEISRVKVNA